MADNDRLETLVAQLEDYRTRAKARRELESLGPDAAPRLVQVMTDADAPENVRWAAVTLMAAWQYADAAPQLLDLVRDHAGLRGEAARALEAITGEMLGEDANAWAQTLGLEVPEEEPGADSDVLPGIGSDVLPGIDSDVLPGVGSDVLPGIEEETEEDHVAVFRNALKDEAVTINWMEDEGYLYLRMPIEDDRKQQVVVTFDDRNIAGQPIITVYTECGEASREAVAIISRRNVTLKHGKFIIEPDEDGNDKVVMRETIPPARLTPELARELVLSMAAEADSLEYEMTQSDRI